MCSTDGDGRRAAGGGGSMVANAGRGDDKVLEGARVPGSLVGRPCRCQDTGATGLVRGSSEADRRASKGPFPPSARGLNPVRRVRHCEAHRREKGLDAGFASGR